MSEPWAQARELLRERLTELDSLLADEFRRLDADTSRAGRRGGLAVPNTTKALVDQGFESRVTAAVSVAEQEGTRRGWGAKAWRQFRQHAIDEVSLLPPQVERRIERAGGDPGAQRTVLDSLREHHCGCLDRRLQEVEQQAEALTRLSGSELPEVLKRATRLRRLVSNRPVVGPLLVLGLILVVLALVVGKATIESLTQVAVERHLKEPTDTSSKASSEVPAAGFTSVDSQELAASEPDRTAGSCADVPAELLERMENDPSTEKEIMASEPGVPICDPGWRLQLHSLDEQGHSRWVEFRQESDPTLPVRATCGLDEIEGVERVGTDYLVSGFATVLHTGDAVTILVNRASCSRLAPNSP